MCEFLCWNVEIKIWIFLLGLDNHFAYSNNQFLQERFNIKKNIWRKNKRAPTLFEISIIFIQNIFLYMLENEQVGSLLSFM